MNEQRQQPPLTRDVTLKILSDRFATPIAPSFSFLVRLLSELNRYQGAGLRRSIPRQQWRRSAR